MPNLPFAGAILHCVGIRYRVTGSGDLQSSLNSLDDVHVQDLRDLPLSSSTNKLPVVLSNFKDQMIQYEFRTTEINEWFNMSSITLFVKPSSTGYAQ